MSELDEILANSLGGDYGGVDLVPDDYTDLKQAIVVLIDKECTRAVETYRTEYEQKHIANAVLVAKLEESELWYNEWGNGKEQIGDGSWEDYYEHRIAELSNKDNV